MNKNTALFRYLAANRYEKLLSPQTLQYQRRSLRRFVDFIPCKNLSELEYSLVQTYFDRLGKKKWSGATLRGHYLIIMAFLNYYHKINVIKFNPYYFIRKVKKYRAHKLPLRAVELSKLLGAKCNYRYKKEFQFSRNRVVMGLLVYCGLRAGEITQLENKDIYLNRGYLKVNRGKYNIDRIVPLVEPLVTWIKAYFASKISKRSKHFLIGLFRKRCLDRNTLNKIVKAHARAAGLKKRVYCHLIRHSFASQMLKGNVDLNNLRILMGHNDIEMTAMYAKPDKEMIRAALLANPLFGYYGNKA